MRSENGRFLSSDKLPLAAIARKRVAIPRALFALLVIAVGARLWALTNFNQLQLDPDGYLEIARNLVSGDGFGYSNHRPPSAYRPPLYPCLLAMLVVAFRGAPQWLSAGIGGLHVVLGAATAWLVVLTGRRLGLGKVSSLAGLVTAIDPLLIYNSATLMTETLAAFLAALLLYCSARRPDGRWRLGTGVVFGLCCLCRPTFWVFGAFIAAGWLVCFWRARSRNDLEPGSRQEDWRRTATQVALGTALVVTLWVFRNQQSLGQPILTTTHGGYTLLLAHNQVYVNEVVDRPWGAVMSDASFAVWTANLESSLAQEDPRMFGRSYSPAVEIARDRWMNDRAWQFIRDDPATALRTGLTLLGRLWNIAPLSTPQRPVSSRQQWPIGGFYAAVFLTMLVGLVRIRRAEWSRWWPLPLLLLAFSAVHTLYWADMRMRAPLVPAIALLAARAFVRSTNQKMPNGRVE